MTQARMPAARFSLRLRVYYEDTDAGGIVYHANYLRYMERARTDWLRALGARHRDLAHADGLGFVVREMHLQFLKPARLDDELEADVVPTEVRRASMRLEQNVSLADGGEPLATATVRIAIIDRTTGRPRPLPRWLFDRLTLDPVTG